MVYSFPKATSFRNMMPMLFDGCTANTMKIILEIKVPNSVYDITNCSWKWRECREIIIKR